ncbi:MAG: hypothetical protein K6G64_03610, partial [Eubacterium sp.]|nr:hypothetical protein [Eubacterium sp.]
TMFAENLFLEFSGMVAVQLSMFFAVVLSATAIRLYHIVLALSTTFLKFFKTFFLKLFVAFCDSQIIITYFQNPVNNFFKVF